MISFGVVTVLGALALAYANGANDVSKAVATLVGSGLASYRRALVWGTAWTVAGALMAYVVATGLLRTFSTGLVSADVSQSALFPVSVALGACAWVILATHTGLPVSTTHSLTGAIVGAALVSGGASGITWPLVAATVALPLALSPFLSGVIAWVLSVTVGRRVAAASQYCVCLEQRPLLQIVSGPGEAAAVDRSVPGVVVGSAQRCADDTVVGRLRLTDAAHWGTSAALSFARGLNDSPKILALSVFAAASADVSSGWLFVLGAAAMGLGSCWYGRRVTETLAAKVAAIDRTDGLISSAVASALVLMASTFGLPVSTTHVASGSLVGAALGGGAGAVRWSVVGSLAAAWVITLPVSAAFAALATLIVRQI